MDPKNKVAFITGGASGIGFAIAKALLKNGAKGVTLVDITDEEGKEATRKLNEEFGAGKCLFAKADVRNNDELEVHRNMDPKNKVAFITGGASGIGFAIAKALLKNGAKGVTIVDITDEEGKEATRKLNEEFGAGKCIFAKADVRNNDELEVHRDMDPKNKVAFITGGASGIGFAIAKALLKNGAKGVTLVDITDEEGKEATRKLNEEFGAGKCIFAKADVRNNDELEDAFKTAVATFNQLDIVYSNAGICNENKLKDEYNTNLIGSAQCILLALDTYLPKYKSTDEGVIFNTSSVVAFGADFALPHYAASKAGILSLTLSFGDEFHFKRTGVKVKALCPSLTKTTLVANLGDFNLKYDTKVVDLLERFPPQTADEFAQCALEILQECKENGALWVVESGKKRKAKYPTLL